jgi:putative glycosyltransferase (TIGR04372 family)
MFELLPEYESYARLRLEEYGLSKSDWFVTLHVRNTGSAIDVREQSIKDYLASINLIIANGGKVIRIGDPSMEKINAIPGFIDLSRDSKLHTPLHLYALAKAKFFIGTNSGPKMYPPLYGVPSLITNLTSIGLETFTLSPGTIYIPKTYTREGEKLPLVEILGSHIGYDNFNRRQLFERGIGVADTSQLDILKGVEEMLQYVFGLAPERNNEFDIQVERIRSASQFSTSGRFSATWLSENENWFLRT